VARCRETASTARTPVGDAVATARSVRRGACGGELVHAVRSPVALKVMGSSAAVCPAATHLIRI